MKLYLVQMTSTHSIDDNIKAVEFELEKAAIAKADLVILPEMFAQIGGSNNESLATSERDFNGVIGSLVRRYAKKAGYWVVAGSIPVNTGEDSRPKARCFVINSGGEQVVHYDKIHLFDAAVGDKQGSYKESDSYSPGNEVVTFESPWGTIGLAICYDLRFPELFQQLNKAGAKLVCLPSAFTYKTGEAHWEVLNRARAIENGFFVAAVNQCGQHSENRFTWEIGRAHV